MDSDCYSEVALKDVGNHKILSSYEYNYLFRGQADKDWKLETSLDRFLKHIPDADKSKVEPHLIEEFQRRYFNYSQTTAPDFDNRIEWWSIMQHYGAPTRLFDWTYSFFIAMFFAIEDIESKAEEAAIWAIDTDWLREKHKKFSRLTKLLTADPHMKDIETFKTFDGKPIVLRLNPYLLHERLSIQQGCFLIPGNASISFLDNLIKFSEGKGDLKQHLYKIIISNVQEERRKMLEGLYRKNISRASLFPGLDGYAHSLRTITYSMPRLLRKPELVSRMKGSWAWND